MEFCFSPDLGLAVTALRAAEPRVALHGPVCCSACFRRGGISSRAGPVGVRLGGSRGDPPGGAPFPAETRALRGPVAPHTDTFASV